MGIMESFWGKVSKSDGCWEWMASKVCGYGSFTSGANYGLSTRAHRISWELTYGPIPKGVNVCHTCDNRVCVNPKHLFLGTTQDNTDDKVSKGRQAQGPDHSKKILGCGPKGESVGTSKLSLDQVMKIRHSPDRKIDLAQRFGVTRQMVHKIQTLQSWRSF